MYLSPALLKWGSLGLALISTVSAIMNLTCSGVDEGFCSSYNDYLIWVGAACALLASLAIIFRPSTQYYSAAIRYGLPTLALLAAGFGWATAGTSLCPDDRPVWLNWTNMVLSGLTLLLLGYDSFYLGIGSGAYAGAAASGYDTGYGNTGYDTGYGNTGYDTGY
jgi:hypothetical protein